MRPLEHRARWIPSLCMNAYLIRDCEFMLSALAGGNVKMHDLQGFYCNGEGDARKTGHTVESFQQRMCSEWGGKQKRLKEQNGRVAKWDKKGDEGRGEEGWSTSREMEAEGGGRGGGLHLFLVSLHVSAVWYLFKINLRYCHSAGVSSFYNFYIISSSSSGAVISRAPQFIFAAQSWWIINCGREQKDNERHNVLSLYNCIPSAKFVLLWVFTPVSPSFTPPAQMFWHPNIHPPLPH